MQARRLKIVKIIFTLFFVVCSLLLFSHKARAASWSNPIVSATTQMASNESYQDSAVNMTVNVKGMPLAYSASVTKGLHIWLARYTDTQTYRSYWAVKSPYDQYFVNLTGVPNDLISLVPGTDTLTWDQYTGNYNYGGLVTARDGWKALSLSFADGKPYYSLDPSKARQWFVTKDYNDNATQLRVLSRAISSNGRYVLAWIGYDYYVRLDLDTNAIQYVGRFPGAWYGGPAYNPYAGAITNDGRYVFIYGGPQVVDLSGCGVALTETQVVEGTNVAAIEGCPVVRLSDVVQEKVGYAGYDSGYHWSDDGESLVFFINPFPYTTGSGGPATKVTLRLTSEATSTLDYLALGDSYSSGEGDYEANAYDRHNNFLPNTDEVGPPSEKCHLSYHSYPMLLRDHYDIKPSLMRSVACSGALTIDVDKYANQSLGIVNVYQGQQDRLKNFLGVQAYQTLALTDFIPGRIEQIKFVEKYKPKVLTVGIGGNDVEFAGMIAKCVKDPNVKCSEAQENGEARQRLARLMRSEFYVLRDLYLKLRSVSPQTKIYVIGYPQFIADSGVFCFGNAGYADANERHFMNEATHYMNLVIKSAAKAAGVQYVDIENSLDGGRLCEGIFTDYVTGARDQWWIQAILDESLRAYLYHPNAKGHQKIAKLIEEAVGSGFMNGKNSAADSSTEPPAYTDYFGGSTTHSTITTLPVTSSSGKNVYKQGQQIIDTSQAYSYQPDSAAVITRHSEPVSLGEFPVDDQGRLHYQITIPADTPPGPHQLVFTGVSPSGEPIEYVQEIFVIGSDSNDVDGDGIPDNQDQCLFIEPSGQDADHDGVDDACDDVIAIQPGARTGMNGLVNDSTNDNPKVVVTDSNTNSSETTIANNKPVSQSDASDKEQTSSLLMKVATQRTLWSVVGLFVISVAIAYIIFHIRKRNYDQKTTSEK